MKKLKYLTAALMLGLVIFLTSSTEPVSKQNNFAGRKGARFHYGMQRGMKQGMNFGMFNNLTDEQKDQIGKIHTEKMKKALPVLNQINEKKAELRTLTTGDNIDIKSAEKVLEDIEDLKTELSKQKILTQLDVRNVLTDEQKIFFDARRSMDGKRGKAFAGRGMGMKGRFGQDQPMPCKGKPAMQGMKPRMHGEPGPGMKGGTANAQGMGRGMNGRPGMPGMQRPQGKMQGTPAMAWMKDLTDEQKDQLKTLKLEQIKAMTRFKNELDEYKAKLRILTTSDQIKMKDVDKAIDQMGKIRLEMAKEKLQHRMNVRNLLTDEQRVKFDMQQI